eukprot:CAMPEP_0177670472 /NCGR_PEP_ID=MMETSP0447-20121125/24105_1 /TAXON_ID=0 /ORGANISM="Stygamoeba regulata, Strain BSH-02190019" /LENGTH=954 /DNA_ID=CAMNT_0019177633 /DNA_START=1 /DNA_END=2865 /DNA_ORIENTATION=+
MGASQSGSASSGSGSSGGISTSSGLSSSTASSDAVHLSLSRSTTFEDRIHLLLELTQQFRQFHRKEIMYLFNVLVKRISSMKGMLVIDDRLETMQLLIGSEVKLEPHCLASLFHALCFAAVRADVDIPRGSFGGTLKNPPKFLRFQDLIGAFAISLRGSWKQRAQFMYDLYNFPARQRLYLNFIRVFLKMIPSPPTEEQLSKDLNSVFGDVSSVDFEGFWSSLAKTVVKDADGLVVSCHPIAHGYGFLELLEQLIVAPCDEALKEMNPSIEGPCIIDGTRRYVAVKNGIISVYSLEPGALYLKTGAAYPTVSTMFARRLDEAVLVRARSSMTSFQMQFPTTSWTLSLSSEEEADEWVKVICMNVPTQFYRYLSFSPVRHRTAAQLYVDGVDMFPAAAAALRSAKHEIFLTGWSVNPEVYLCDRNKPVSAEDRLDRILLDRARQGVRVYVLIWRETRIALGGTIHSEYTKRTLQALHPNIHVMRHPLRIPVLWSHHQKIIVVDQSTAFVGGLDLAFGRYDDPEHTPDDSCHLQTKWPGKDFHNPRIQDFQNLDQPFTDIIDRTSEPRMPWHDIHCRIDGWAARDVAWNFIERWNAHKRDLEPSKQPVPWLCLDPAPPSSSRSFGSGTCKCQVLRSISPWSGGLRTEFSIYTCYLDLIARAKHFIYIENQYFISSMGGGGIQNRVAEAICQRVSKAIETKEPFRVVIVLPIQPAGGTWEHHSVRFIMKWQYQTICRGGTSLLETLEARHGDIVHDYVQFVCLRNWAVINKSLHVEQIYVHSKLMIVDDRYVIIASANINDRSLLGVRDSEIGVVLEDIEFVCSSMAGQPYLAGKSILELRLSLWREHLGIVEMSDLAHDVVDPLSLECVRLWKTTANTNARIYQSVFPLEMSRGLHSREMRNNIEKLLPPKQTDHQLKQLLKLRGHVVDFPYDFLKDEDLTPPSSSAEAWMPEVFQ